MNDKKLFWILAAGFAGAYLIPFDQPQVQAALVEAFMMLQEYAREHVLLCLLPALFIAGGIANFLSQGAVLQYFGADAKKWLSYGVASVSGLVLAVCSCTVLPLFAGIYKRGAGLGPATAFLYAGPAVNILAITMTARILGWQFGLARAVGAVLFAVVIGVIMGALFPEPAGTRRFAASEDRSGRGPWQDGLYFLLMIAILVVAAWSQPPSAAGLAAAVYRLKWPGLAVLGGLLALILWRWFDRQELTEWTEATWDFAKQILPLLGGGVLLAGFLMGRPESSGGIVPPQYISAVVGGNSLGANFIAAGLGALMYFATLTEVPILQGLLGAGMGSGPALALLLAGPALSLPNMLVIGSVLGAKKTLVFLSLVTIMAAISGFLFGQFAG